MEISFKSESLGAMSLLDNFRKLGVITSKEEKGNITLKFLADIEFFIFSCY